MASKKEIQQRVFKNGKPLDLDKFEWDEKTNTFSSSEDYLVLGFNGVSGCTFNTGSHCTFKTEFDCTFNTGSYCTFNTGSDCTFKTGENCVVVRKDTYEVIELKSGQKIKLKEYSIKGYDILDKSYLSSITAYQIKNAERGSRLQVNISLKGKKVKIRLFDNQVVEGEIIEDYPPN